MKLDNAINFYQNILLNQAKLRFIGLSGASLDKLLEIVYFIDSKVLKKWVLPDDLGELSQLCFFSTHEGHILCHVEKMKKDPRFCLSLIKSLEGVVYLLSTTAAGLESFYQELKNEMIWLELSQEKPWQVKDRMAGLLQALSKHEGYSLDRQAATYLLDNEDLSLERAKARFASCKTGSGPDRKISLDLIKSFLPQKEAEIDFAWIDKLIFKSEALEKPSCEDATDFLLFLGQLRYTLTTAIKLKSLQNKGLHAQDMKLHFPKMTPQGLSIQIKKTEGVTSDYLKAILGLIYDKELELKQDFLQPNSLFVELIAKITEQKLCQKPVH